MTRYKSDTKEKTRARIVEEASRQFRAKGVGGTSIADVMDAVGMTVGGFYKHFASKDELFREALSASLIESSMRFGKSDGSVSGEAWLKAAAEVYLTTAHRDNVSRGCPLAALSTDIARSDAATRETYEHLLEEYIQGIQNNTGDSSEASRAEAWQFLSTLLGGLILSRSVASDTLSREILGACRKT